MNKENFCALLTNLDERYIAQAGTFQKSKNTVWVKWGAAAACLCAVMICTFALRQQGGLLVDPVQSSPISQREEPSDTPHQNTLFINDVEVFTPDLDVQFTYYDELSEEEKAKWSADFERAAGFPHDALTQKLPAAFSNRRFYTMNAPDKASPSGYSTHDYVLEYAAEAEKSVKIALSALGEPLRCCIVTCDDPQPSEIDGVPVYLYGYGDSFLAQFHCGGVGVDVDASGISQDELETLISNLIQLLKEQ